MKATYRNYERLFCSYCPKSLKSNVSFALRAQVGLATFQVLSYPVWPVASVLDSTDPEGNSLIV